MDNDLTIKAAYLGVTDPIRNRFGPRGPGYATDIIIIVFVKLATVPVLEDIARAGTRRTLQEAIEQDVAQYVEEHRQHQDGSGHRLVVQRFR